MKLIKKTFSTILPALTALVSVNAQENELFRDTFELSPKPEWILQVANENKASWTLEDGVLSAKALAGNGLIMVDNPVWDNYIVEVEFKFADKAAKHIGLVFRASPPKVRHALYFTGFVFNIHADKAVLQMVDPVWRKLKEVKLIYQIDNNWHRLKVELNDESIKCYLDDNLLINEESGKMNKGGAGLRIASGSAAFFKNFIIKSIK